jgi:hypothetical protein
VVSHTSPLLYIVNELFADKVIVFSLLSTPLKILCKLDSLFVGYLYLKGTFWPSVNNLFLGNAKQKLDYSNNENSVFVVVYLREAFSKTAGG